MKTQYFKICENYNCSKYNVLQDIDTNEFDFKYGFDSYCSECHYKMTYKLIHGKITFETTDSLVAYLKSLANEYKALKRLVDKNMADDAETLRYQELIQILDEAKCPCCQQYILK